MDTPNKTGCPFYLQHLQHFQDKKKHSKLIVLVHRIYKCGFDTFFEQKKGNPGAFTPQYRQRAQTTNFQLITLLFLAKRVRKKVR